jgi:hypothetical protein
MLRQTHSPSRHLPNNFALPNLQASARYLLHPNLINRGCNRPRNWENNPLRIPKKEWKVNLRTHTNTGSNVNVHLKWRFYHQNSTVSTMCFPSLGIFLIFFVPCYDILHDSWDFISHCPGKRLDHVDDLFGLFDPATKMLMMSISAELHQKNPPKPQGNHLKHLQSCI